jgi:tol-pal system protein YbgF
MRASAAETGCLGLRLVTYGVVAGLSLALGQAFAQQGAPSWQGSAQQQRPQQQAPRTKPPQKAPAESATGGGSEASLRQRVEQLEEQIVDLQVVVGTVESLARAGGASSASSAYRGGVPSSGGGSGADAGRIAALETQVQALTIQLEQMSQQLRQLQSGAPRGPSGPAPRIGAGGFSTTTVSPAEDPIASIINTPEPRGSAPRGVPPPMATSSAAGRQLYDAAYSQLLQQNYPAAEAGFRDFLQSHPNDELSPNAQFWLGETHFVRGQWDSAAAAFLKVAQNYPRSDKAPDSLAKLAMSMERKGDKVRACRTLQELNARYPNPPQHVRTWEMAERRRAGCS